MNSNWQNKIRQHEVSPPGDAWNNIAGMLDTPPGFADKLHAFEATPPAVVQKNIFDLLDASSETRLSFSEKVYHYQTAAPAEAWPNIVSALDKESGRVLPLQPPLRRKSSVYVKIAAGIILIAAISIGIRLISLNNKTGITEPTAAIQPQTLVKPNKASTIPGNAVAAIPAQIPTTLTAQETSAKNYHHTSPVSYVQDQTDITLAQDPAHGKIDKLRTITGEIPQDIAAMDAGGGYVLAAGPDGERVRISAKLSSYISLLTEKNPGVQENIDIIIKESAKWRATFAEWRERMINNAVAPSIANFMDIIELSNLLEEKN